MVQSATGSPWALMVVSDTRIRRNGGVAALQDLKNGDRIRAEIKRRKDGTIEAVEIKALAPPRKLGLPARRV